MALDSFSTLKTSIADWLNRDDLTSVIPDYITLVEAELGRILKGRPMTTSTSVVFDTTGLLAAPSDMVRPRSLTLETDLYGWPVEVKPYEYVIQKQAQLINGAPRYAALVGSTFTIAPTPDSDTLYTGVLIYDAALTPLSDSNTTNWVLTNHPDVYLFGSLYHAAPYLKNDERIPVWESRYYKGLDQIRELAQQAEFGANTPIVRPISALGS